MQPNKNDMIVLYIKNECKRRIVTQQTKKIREKTNENIRQLGNKYFLIKSLFERLNLKRDDIFLYANKLVEEYKNIKNGIYIHNQIRRMKDALYCWYAEFFFNEIFIPNSVILNGLVENSYKLRYESKIFTPKHVDTTQRFMIHDKKIKNSTTVTTSEQKINQIFQPITTNQEIDTPEFSNIISNSTDDINTNDNLDNLNYDFDKLFK